MTAVHRSPVGPSHIRVWAVLVLAALAIGSAGFMVLEGWTLLDALFMTVITITTVGFQEVHPLDPAGKVWTMLVTLTGVGLLFGFVGIVAEYLLAEATSGKREASRMAAAMATLHDHFVLCGYGRVGSTVARGLRHDGEDVVVIDIHPESLARATQEGFLCVSGDATDDATLRQAGIERARGLITTVDADATNVYVILSARVLNPRLFVVARANAASAEAKLLQAGADRVVSPYTMAGRRLAGLALRPRVVDFIDAALSHGELAFALEEVTVEPGGRLDEASVGQLRQEGIFTLAVVREDGQYEANPVQDRRLTAGEILIVSGEASVLSALRETG